MIDTIPNSLIQLRISKSFYCRSSKVNNDQMLIKFRDFYSISKLNPEQSLVYKYISENDDAIVLLQAGPGCGKTFIMMTLAYNQPKGIRVVVFKKDLLSGYQYAVETRTNARFFMALFDINYFTYVNTLEKQLTCRLASYEYIACIIHLLQTSRINDFLDNLIILDEYTVINKTLLFIILLLFETCKTNVVICGDKNQLQSIHDSHHAKYITSFEIASCFTKKQFTLSENVRCADENYSKIIDYISEFSCEDRIDDWGYSLLVALFPLQTITAKPPTDCYHIASTHQELANNLVSVYPKAIKEFYYIEHTNSTKVYKRKLNGTPYMEDGKIVPFLFTPYPVVDYMESKVVGKFLPYLPLVVGCKYFYKTLSELTIVTIREIDSKKEQIFASYDTEPNKIIKITKDANDSVMFQDHKQYILGQNGLGSVYNYPLYPAFSMSTYMCQGRTITADLNLIFGPTITYRSIYVMLSRVKKPTQIKKININNALKYLVSAVYNFPNIKQGVTARDIHNRMLNYTLFEQCGGGDYKKLYNDICIYLTSPIDQAKDAKMYSDISNQLDKGWSTRIIHPPSPTDYSGIPNKTMDILLKLRKTIMALSFLKKEEYQAWLLQFRKVSMDMIQVQNKYDLTQGESGDAIKKFCGVENMHKYQDDVLGFIKLNKSSFLESMESAIKEDRCNEQFLYTLLQEEIRKLDAASTLKRKQPDC